MRSAFAAITGGAMHLYKQKGSENWYYDLHVGGRRSRRSTGTPKKEDAKTIAEDAKARFEKVRVHGKHFTEAVGVWLQERERGPSIKRAVSQIWAAYDDRPIGEVTEESIVETFGDKKPGTYNKLAAIFRATLNLACARGWMATAPRIARRTEPVVEPSYLTAAEWKRLRAELPDHLRPMADFAISTGLRWSNVAGLAWDRVDLVRKQAWIPASQAKARRTIPVPLSDAAIAALRSIPGKKRTGPVFLYDGATIASPKTAWNKAVERAGVPWCRWHDLRHTWASWHAMAGTPLDVLQQLGGWQTRDMVQRYAHLAPSYVAKFAGNARPVRAKRAA